MDTPTLHAILTAYMVDNMSVSAIAKTYKVPLWMVGYALAQVNVVPTIRRASVTSLSRNYALRLPKGLRGEIPKSWIGRKVAKVIVNKRQRSITFVLA